MPTIKHKSPRRPWQPERRPFVERANRNHEFYVSTAWRKLRNEYIVEHPLCAMCGRAAEMVDHIVPINKGGAPLDPANLQSLCNHCHNIKSATDK